MSRSTPIVWSTRVPFRDADMTGLLHNSVYLEHSETAINEFIRSHRLKEHFDVSDRGWAYHARRSELVFHRPSRYDDVLDFAVRVSHLGRSSLTFDIDVLGPGETSPRVSGSITWVCVEAARGSAMPIPPHTRSTLEPLHETGRLSGDGADDVADRDST